MFSNPQSLPIHRLITQQAIQTPDAVAVVFNDQQLTYGELNARSNQFAHYLQSLGVKPEVLVGVYLERSAAVFVALLGILKAGGAYVPLDPAFPAERIALMLEDAQAPILVSQHSLEDGLPTHSAQCIAIDRDWDIIATYPSTDIEVTVSPKDLAYIIYTSGSTGRPKGVQISHDSLINLLISMATTPGLSSTDVFLSITTISFDMVVPELYLPLLVGAKIVMGSRAVATDPTKLTQLLESSGATCFQATPTTWRMLIAAQWQGHPKLKILCGGEAMTRSLADQLLDRCGELWNMYGPTETTVWSMACRVEANGKPVPLGEPIANTQIYIIPEATQRQDDPTTTADIGESGELYIGGIGVARGYLNRPELTAEKFIADPYNPGGRLYRTGDLARRSLNGDIEIIGRADNQVKIRGYRIELGDIETALSEHPDVQVGVVIAPEDSSGTKRLVAYVVAAANATIVPLSLRAWLSEKLPHYMVPSTVIVMDTLPMTPNCKVDRRSLPLPNLDQQEAIIAPRNAIETQLVKLWSEVLEIEVGIHQNFLECGGDSLRTALLMSRINETFKLQVPLECLFKAPTVAGFAPLLETIRTVGTTEFTITPEQLRHETNLPADIQKRTAIKANQHQLFLTGATGFIGAFLLQELLLKQPQARVYCLVRAKDLSTAIDRLRTVMQNYEIWDDRFGERIIPILGDLEKPMFGMTEQQFCELADKVDVIYHSGAYVNLLYPYSALRAANVGGTIEILRLATIGQTLPVHYISTIDVFHSYLYNGFEPILESDPLLNSEGYFEGYAQTKWVAEKLVMNARDRGLPVTIYRLGMITGHSRTGGSQLGNLVCRMIKGFIQLGSAPDLAMEMVLAPVDYVVSALAYLAAQPQSLGQTYHLVSPDRLSMREFVGHINTAGYAVKLMPNSEWCEQLLQMSVDNALTPAAAMFIHSEQHGGSLIATSTCVAQIHDDRRAQADLQPSGITCPAVGETTIAAYIQYLIRNHFLTQSVSDEIEQNVSRNAEVVAAS
jgi:amino acid adenylation domain-containing protein/thioester reductase-like protein